MIKRIKYSFFLSLLIGMATLVVSFGNGFGDIQETGAVATSTQSWRAERPSGVALPIKVQIPKMNVNANIEYVGETEEGRMDIPKNDINLAWWRYGARPGEEGSAVLAGHIDRREGGPGIFYNLQKLQPGDIVKVTDANNKVYEYEVVNTFVFEDSEFPMKLIFGKKDKKRLNLITCYGRFDKHASNYEERLVVFTEMVE